MKQLIAALLAAVMLLSLAACGKQSDPTEDTTETTAETTQAVTEEITVTTEATTEATTETTEETTEATEETEPEKGVWGTVVNTTALHIRAKASPESKSLATLAAGSRVEILEQVTADGVAWGRILYAEADAWVCMNYIRLDGTVVPTAPHEHDYKDKKVVAPTCTEGGYTRYTCKCGDYYDAAYTAPLGHDMGPWYIAKAPTARDTGIEQRKCNRCSAEENKVLPATGETQPTTPPTTAPTEPVATEPAATECSHDWVAEYHPAVTHEVVYYVCACQARFSSFDELQAHFSSFIGNGAEGINHTSYGTVAETVTDTPEYTTYTCSKCGATK